MFSRMTRPVVASAALLLAGLSLQVVTASTASATTCSMVGSGLNRHQYCSGLHHEYLGSKFSKGTAVYYDGRTHNVEASIDVIGRLADKARDGNCTWLRLKVTSPTWPQGNIVTNKKYKRCDGDPAKNMELYIHGAYTYPGSKVEVQHCQRFRKYNQTVCDTFFKRTIPSS